MIFGLVSESVSRQLSHSYIQGVKLCFNVTGIGDCWYEKIITGHFCIAIMIVSNNLYVKCSCNAKDENGQV